MTTSSGTAPSDPNSADVPATMRAVVRTEYGDPDALRLDTVPVPQPGRDEVLVRVRAAGLDRGAEHMMTGTPYVMRLATGLRRPKRPRLGQDVAGTVVRVGAKVTEFSAGDDVFGFAPGAFAEYAAGPEAKLALKPPSLSFAQAAVVPVSGTTAQQALVEVGRVQPGQAVLVVGASGGVGTFAVQLAKALGAEVTGVCSTAKVDLVKSLGADHVLDYTNQDFAIGDRGYELILDIGGNSSIARLRRALTAQGTVVFVGGETGASPTGLRRQAGAALFSPFQGHRFAMMLAKERSSDLEALALLIEEGQIAPVLDRTYPLAQAADAMRLLGEGKVRGKIALTV